MLLKICMYNTLYFHTHKGFLQFQTINCRVLAGEETARGTFLSFWEFGFFLNRNM